MEFNQIRYFRNLADTLNFTEAANAERSVSAHAHPRNTGCVAGDCAAKAKSAAELGSWIPGYEIPDRPETKGAPKSDAAAIAQVSHSKMRGTGVHADGNRTYAHGVLETFGSGLHLPWQKAVPLASDPTAPRTTSRPANGGFMERGIMGLPAPPLEHVRWIDENGDERSPLTLAELGQDFKILYFFQDWCAGCHRHGFPTFVTLAEELRDKGVGLAAIQTVFEGSEVNTFDRLRENQRRTSCSLRARRR